jgi:hypothetical protein
MKTNLVFGTLKKIYKGCLGDRLMNVRPKPRKHLNASPFHNRVSRSGAATARGRDLTKIFDPSVPLEFKDGRTITPLVISQKPDQTGKNLMRIYKGTVIASCESDLLAALKKDMWLCLNFDDFKWDTAILRLKEIRDWAHEKGFDIVNQVVIADMQKLNDVQAFTAQTEFALAGGHFYPYQDKTFEAAAASLDADIQEEKDDYSKRKAFLKTV